MSISRDAYHTAENYFANRSQQEAEKLNEALDYINEKRTLQDGRQREMIISFARSYLGIIGPAQSAEEISDAHLIAISITTHEAFSKDRSLSRRHLGKV